MPRRPGLLVRLRTLAEAGQSRSAAVRTLRAEGFRFGSDRIRAFYNIFAGRNLSTRQNRAIGLPDIAQVRRRVGRGPSGFARGASLQSFHIRYRAQLNYNVADLARNRQRLRNADLTLVGDLIIPIDSDRLLRLRNVIQEDIQRRGMQLVEADIRSAISGNLLGSATIQINLRTSEIFVERGQIR